MEETEDDEKKYNLRMSHKLYSGIEMRAARNNRSVNAEMVTILERFVDSEEVMLEANDGRLNIFISRLFGPFKKMISFEEAMKAAEPPVNYRGRGKATPPDEKGRRAGKP